VINTHNPVRVAVVGDSLKWPRWLATRAEHHPNLLAIDVPPLANVTNLDVAEATLDGLGKDRRLRIARRPVEVLVAAWLSVTERTDALILDATVLPEAVTDDLVNTLVAFGLTPWLVIPHGAHHDHDERRRVIDGLVERYDAELLGPDDLVAAWPDTEPVDPPPVIELHGWPRVPRVDGIYFRSAVRDLLDHDDAAFVDSYFVAAVHAIRAELAGIKGRDKARQFSKHLRHRMHDAVSDEEVITIVRAAQVAGVTAGYHVRVNPIGLYGGLGVVPRRGHVVRDDWWNRLEPYPDPDVAAVAALHMAGMDLADIRTLTTDYVEELPGGTLHVTGDSGASVTLDGEGARFVRAAVAWRLLGAGHGPLFGTHRAEHISNQRLGYLARLSQDVGVRHTGTKTHRKEQTTATWLDNFGITITRSTKAPNS
jgi:hypothetical protein